MEDKSIWASAMKTGMNNFYPVSLIENQIKKAERKNINKKELNKYREELEKDIEFLKNNDIETIKKEIIKEQGLRGFKLIKEEKIK